MAGNQGFFRAMHSAFHPRPFPSRSPSGDAGLALRDFGGRLVVKPLAPLASRGIHAITRRGEGRDPKIVAVLEQLARSVPRNVKEG
ncbi:hypothetical protein RHEC894_CH02510 [Rhizobium sp. CIAT894]|nr:hypothetical protein RHEC894_CH02510 [Rhizobium sp. CIAT894]